MDLPELIDHYVIGRYNKLLHGNFTAPTAHEFVRKLAEDAARITDEELSTLLDLDWRPKLTAAWLIGMDRRDQFRPRLGELLLESQYVFAGQGYCFALMRFAATADAAILASYLDKYLRQHKSRYDQMWALIALERVDAALGRNYAGQFTWPGGPWDQWAKATGTTEQFRALFGDMLSIVDSISP